MDARSKGGSKIAASSVGGRAASSSLRSLAHCTRRAASITAETPRCISEEWIS